jgi:hypothetical protein
MTAEIEERLAAAGERWRAAQPAPPSVDPSRFAAGTRIRQMRRVRWAPLAAAAAVAVLVAGVGVARFVDRAPTPSITDGPATAHDPLALIGSWRLTGVDGEPGGVLRLSDRDLALFRPCGRLSGSWRASTDGLFVGDVHGITRCPVPPPSDDWTPVWLRNAVAFRVDGTARELLDAGGEPVARLLPGGEPATGQLWLNETAPPVVTDRARTEALPAAPLPPHLVPASHETLIGRWVADEQGGTQRRPFVELNTDGQLHGSDGCNSSSGRWVAGPDGALLATEGPSTMMACSNLHLTGWVSQARRAGFDGDVLVLLDANGVELGRLHRD